MVLTVIYRPFTLQFDVASHRKGERGSDDLIRLLREAPTDTAFAQICCDKVHSAVPKMERLDVGRYRLWAVVPESITAEQLIDELRVLFEKNGWFFDGVGS